jgi:hypothetical protein
MAIAAAVATGGFNNNMGAGGLTIMSVGIMVCLAALIIPVYVANRHPASPRHPDRRVMKSPVLGGMHRGDGRSVAPRRDAPAGKSRSGHADHAS